MKTRNYVFNRVKNTAWRLITLLLVFLFFQHLSAQDKGRISTWHLASTPQGVTAEGRAYQAHWDVQYVDANGGFIQARLWPKNRPECYSLADFKWEFTPNVNEVNQDEEIRVHLSLSVAEGPGCSAPTDPFLALYVLKGLMYNKNVGGEVSKEGIELFKNGSTAPGRIAGKKGTQVKEGYIVVKDRTGAGYDQDAQDGGFFLSLQWRGVNYAVFYKYQAGPANHSTSGTGTLTLNQDQYTTGSNLIIRFENLTNSGSPLNIGIVPAGTTSQELGAELTASQSIGQQTSGIISLTAPQWPGNYVVVLYDHQGNILTTSGFSVATPSGVNTVPNTESETSTDETTDCGPPKLAGHHQWLDMSLQECLNRSKAALRAAGLAIQEEYDGYVSGEGGVHAAYIRCLCTINGLQPTEETLVDVTVGTPDDWLPGPGILRDYLVGYMQQPSLAGLPPALGMNADNIFQSDLIGNAVGFTPLSENIPQNVCQDPRALQLMDQWLQQALPFQKPGESLRYEAWGRIIGNSQRGNLSVTGPPDTPLSRCEWLWAYATGLSSQNLGTLRDYVLKNWQ